MTNKYKTALVISAGLFATAFTTMDSHAADRRICNPGNGITGTFGGDFFTYFESSTANDERNSNVCITLTNTPNRGEFTIDFNQPRTFKEDVVGGVGFANGSPTRVINYELKEIKSNSSLNKNIAGVYGWTCGSRDRAKFPKTKAQEYYVVNSWTGRGQYVPFDENAGREATPIKEIRANGATYDIYVVGRDGPQFCGDGTSREFEQFWSVRRGRLPAGTGKNNQRTVDFANHVNAWRSEGFSRDKVRNGYQVVFGEAFGAGPNNGKRHVGTVNARIIK